MKHTSGKAARQTDPSARGRKPRRTILGLTIVACMSLLLLAVAQPASAQECRISKMNTQCNDFGIIAMANQGDIRGEPITLTTTVRLNTAYADEGARWILFSVRNTTADGSDPVTIQVTKFSASGVRVVTTEVEQPSPNEVNLWVDVLDTPVGTPITLSMKVGSTERGAFRLETLVMAFDRGYTPIKDNGSQASLFSFTLLGVNKETAGATSDKQTFLEGNKVPGFGLVPALGAMAVAAVLVARGRKA